MIDTKYPMRYNGYVDQKETRMNELPITPEEFLEKYKDILLPVLKRLADK